MFWTHRCAMAGSLWVSIFLADGSRGDEKAGPAAAEVEAAALVRQALENEVAGDGAARDRLLGDATAIAPDYPPARWHGAHVQLGDEWMAAAEAQKRQSTNERIQEYQAKREAAENPTLELRLAQWCLKNGMEDRARVHFWRVVRHPTASSNQIQDAARQLDLVIVGGLVLTRAELKAEQLREQRIAEAIGKYRPILGQLQIPIDAGFDGKHDAAAKKLAAIDDPAVIAAVETFLSQHREGFGEELVKLLVKFPHVEATQTLARFAVASPYLSVRERAIAELKQRPLHDYIPTLLSGLVAPLTSQFRVAFDRRGNVLYQHQFYQAGAEFNRLWQQNTIFRPTTSSSISYTDKPRAQIPAGMLRLNSVEIPPQMLLLEFGLMIEARKLQVEAANRASTQANNRTFDVLMQATALNPPPVRDVQAWWKWWQQYNEVHYVQPTRYQFVGSQRKYVRNYISGFLTTHPSCFLAGTPIWTETGLRPIESIQPGDRVLSQDPDSGELAFKVVTGKTVRPPAGASRLDILGESITTTLGHPLWVTGQGWEMAKHLKPGDQLHGIHGILIVSTIDPLPDKIEAHNLVVDDFNTYFVGNCGLLVHDNTYRKPTRAVVPGLAP